MGCTKPIVVSYILRHDGKKDIHFSNMKAKVFKECDPESAYYKAVLDPKDTMFLPCSKCISCRLERSRQWAVRCVHEASLYEDNCFLTLTFDDKNLARQCPDGSIKVKHVQDFMKRLRDRFSDIRIRAVYCGEYGEKFKRPHYHVLLFNFNFKDRVLLKINRGNPLHVSDTLSSLWKFGFSTIGDLSFESAAYVARYCTKKIGGKDAVLHYGGRTPEFFRMSLKPAIADPWLEKYGMSDVFLHDCVVINGKKCKPPRSYDKFLEKLDPEMYISTKLARANAAVERGDFSFDRCCVKHRIAKNRFKKLIREIESEL